MGALLLVWTQISVSLVAVTPVAAVQATLIVPIAPADADKLVGVAGAPIGTALKSSFNTLGKAGDKIV